MHKMPAMENALSASTDDGGTAADDAAIQNHLPLDSNIIIMSLWMVGISSLLLWR